MTGFFSDPAYMAWHGCLPLQYPSKNKEFSDKNNFQRSVIPVIDIDRGIQPLVAFRLLVPITSPAMSPYARQPRSPQPLSDYKGDVMTLLTMSHTLQSTYSCWLWATSGVSKIPGLS